jgi:hypothetical protein
MRSQALGVTALVWGPRSMAAQIAASDHGSPHKADTPDAHCSSVATNGWNLVIQGSVPSISFSYLGLVCVGRLLV